MREGGDRRDQRRDRARVAQRRRALPLPWGDPRRIVSVAIICGSLTRDKLIRHLARSPPDGRGWVLLARMDFASERYADAGTSFERAVAASPRVAGDPAVWCEWADALGMAQGGSLVGRPRELVHKGLKLDPTHPKALEMAGSAAFEAQEFAAAARYWRELLTLLPARDRAREELAAAIERADAFAIRAGVPGALPADVR